MIEVTRISVEVPVLGLAIRVIVLSSNDSGGIPPAASAREPPGGAPAAPPPEAPPPPGAPRPPPPAGTSGPAGVPPPADPPRPPGAPRPSDTAPSPAPPPSPGGPGRRKHPPGSLAVPAAAARALMTLLPFVKAVLHRERVPVEDAPDVAQDVLVALLPWWSLRTPDELSAVDERCRGYVRAVARNIARSHLGRRRRVEPGGGAEPFDEDGLYLLAEEAAFPSPEELVLAREEAAERARETDLEMLCRATTPERWRAFRAYAVEGVPVLEIARAERASAGTIYRRIVLARWDLRAAILRGRAGGGPEAQRAQN